MGFCPANPVFNDHVSPCIVRCSAHPLARIPDAGFFMRIKSHNESNALRHRRVDLGLVCQLLQALI
jgi:hypothetical protein